MIVVQSRPAYLPGSLNPGYWRTRRMWGEGSWLNTLLPPNAALRSTTIRNTIRARFAANMTGAWINTTSFTNDPNVFDRFTKYVPFYPSAESNARFFQPVRDTLIAGFPLPPGVTPNPDLQGGFPDRVLCGYDPYRDKYAEIHVARLAKETASGLNEYSWGGIMSEVSKRTNGRWRNKTDSTWGLDGLNESDQMGASGSGLPLMTLGLTRAACRRWNPRTNRFGNLAGPVGICLPPATVEADPVWPALRKDPGSGDGFPWGTRVRLPHDYEITHTNPYVIMIQDALINYGGVGQDTVYGGLIHRGEQGLENEFPGYFDPNGIIRACDYESVEVLEIGSDNNQTPLD